MSIASGHISSPVEVRPASGLNGSHGSSPATATDRVCAIIVTWNRKDFVTTVLNALSKQTYPLRLLDVVVVDNAGTDGTLDHLCATFNPERVVDNDTERADEPRFQSPRQKAWGSAGANTLGLSSLTIVRNRANMGGCGGFNTGFAFVEHWFGKPGAGGPEMVWLVDDDVDLPVDVLEHLHATMASDGQIGLVGSRTCDLNSRERTIETTIYYNRQTGVMQDDPPVGHRSAAGHAAMVEKFGGPRGMAKYTGRMDVDVVSACSMLARWKAVVGESASANAKTDDAKKPVGFWDARYFIYCDDADWCLRFAKAGYKVVLSLDAVVFHTPWNLKLTPSRIYYASRNRLWMAQKVLPVDQLREVTTTAMKRFLAEALYGAMHRRAYHSRIILQTASDIAGNVGGKTGSDGPAALPIVEALKSANLLDRNKRVAVLCCTGDAPKWGQALRAEVEKHAPGKCPQFMFVCRNDVPAPIGEEVVVYGPQLASRLKKQLWMLKRRPHAAIVYDLINDFPILFTTRHTLHIDSKKPTLAQVETDGWLSRAAFFVSWLKARPGLLRYGRTVEPYTSETRYG